MPSHYTNWFSLSVPQIWSLLGAVDTSPQWTHVAGWRKTLELTAHHLRQMRSYREKIATVWPPERNGAARVYLARLDEMVVSVEATYEAAVANYGTISTTTAAIETARQRLAPIHTEYVANEEVLGLPARSPSPGQVPVSVGRQEQLAFQARQVMIELTGTLAAASYAIVIPPGYTAPRIGSVPGTPSLAPALVPPLSTAPRPVSSRPSTVPPRVPAAPPRGRGPVPSVIGPTQRVVPGPGVQPATTQRPATGRPALSGGVIVAPGSAVAGSGGIVGSRGAPLEPPVTRPVQRINPVGGVIAGSHLPVPPIPLQPVLGTSPQATSRSTSSGHRPAPVGAYRTPDGHLVSVKVARPPCDEPHDPSDPWAVEAGVPPIVEPSTPPDRHDPGPAIGLRSRI